MVNPSGVLKRKIAKVAETRLKSLLNKVPKLSSFFSSMSRDSTPNSTPVNENALD